MGGLYYSIHHTHSLGETDLPGELIQDTQKAEYYVGLKHTPIPAEAIPGSGCLTLGT